MIEDRFKLITNTFLSRAQVIANDLFSPTNIDKKITAVALLAITAAGVSYALGSVVPIITVTILSAATVASLYAIKIILGKTSEKSVINSNPTAVNSPFIPSSPLVKKQTEQMPPPPLKKDILLSEQIDYDLLKRFLFTPEKIKEYEADIQKNDFQNFLRLTQLISESTSESSSLIPLLKTAIFFPWFLNQLEILLEKEAISDELCDKLHQCFCKNKIFDLSEERVSIPLEDNTVTTVNKLALLLASPFFRKRFFSNFKDSRQNTLNCQDAPAEVIDILNNFLNVRELKSDYSFFILFEILDLSRMLLISSLHNQIIGLIDNFDFNGQIIDEKQLDDFLETLASYEIKINDHALFSKIQFKAFSVFFKNAYNNSISFDLTKNYFSLPLDALPLLNSNNEIGRYLKGTVNAISLPDILTPYHVETLKILAIQLPQEMVNKIKAIAVSSNFSFTYDKDKISQTFLTFPQVDTIYISLSKKMTFYTGVSKTEFAQTPRLVADQVFQVSKSFPTKQIKLLFNNLEEVPNFTIETLESQFIALFNKIELDFSKQDQVSFSVKVLSHVYRPARDVIQHWQQMLAEKFNSQGFDITYDNYYQNPTFKIRKSEPRAMLEEATAIAQN